MVWPSLIKSRGAFFAPIKLPLSGNSYAQGDVYATVEQGWVTDRREHKTSFSSLFGAPSDRQPHTPPMPIVGSSCVSSSSPPTHHFHSPFLIFLLHHLSPPRSSVPFPACQIRDCLPQPLHRPASPPRLLPTPARTAAAWRGPRGSGRPNSSPRAHYSQ